MIPIHSFGPHITTTCIAGKFGLDPPDDHTPAELAEFLAEWEHREKSPGGFVEGVTVCQWKPGTLAVIWTGSPAFIDRELLDPVVGILSMELFSESFMVAKTTPDLRVCCALFEMTLSDGAREAVQAELSQRRAIV